MRYGSFFNYDVVIIAIIAFVIIIVSAVVILLYRIFRNPFIYPYFDCKFDVSGKRNVDITDYIDKFLCKKNHWDDLYTHNLFIQKWKLKSLRSIENGRFKKLRQKQYNRVLDDSHAFQFFTMRKQTRYRQRNYERTKYEVIVEDDYCFVSWQWLENRYQLLKIIGFESTLKEYNIKNQRSLMTKDLRKQIMERDNYTCQICGKKMFDEVGLQIDHIIPIVKGGKTVPSNLQVLCNRCNSQKGTR